MNKVRNYEEISKLIFQNLKKDIVTNTFLTKTEYEDEINNDSLYYTAFEFGLLIYRSREKYYILNYYLRCEENLIEQLVNELKLTLENINKPIVVEIVAKTETDEKYLFINKVFANAEFKVELKRIRFTLKNDANIKNDVNTENNLSCTKKENDFEKYEYQKPTIQDATNITKLLNENFNEYYGCIPTQDKLKEDIENGSIYIAVNDKVVMENKKIIGVLHIKIGKNNSEIRHLAVDKNYRKNGVASNLMSIYLNEDNSQTKTVWTGTENIYAQKVYEKYGYKKDGYASTVAIKSN